MVNRFPTGSRLPGSLPSPNLPLPPLLGSSLSGREVYPHAAPSCLLARSEARNRIKLQNVKRLRQQILLSDLLAQILEELASLVLFERLTVLVSVRTERSTTLRLCFTRASS